MPEISDDARRNRASWTKVNAEFTDQQASTAWAATEMTWGLFGVPEASINTLGDVNGLDVVEFGCGTAYVSARLARRGAHPVGVDVTPDPALPGDTYSFDKASSGVDRPPPVILPDVTKAQPVLATSTFKTQRDPGSGEKPHGRSIAPLFKALGS